MVDNRLPIRDQGVQLLRSGKVQDAITLLEQALEDNPMDLDTYLFLGFAYANAGQIYKSVDVPWDRVSQG
jgi:cytochrome c-type biogenesis protein CcmH/NrfG